MTKQAEQVLQQALALNDEDRWMLSEALASTLDATTDSATETAWQAELKRRIDDVESGRVQTIPWEQVQKMLEQDASNHD